VGCGDVGLLDGAKETGAAVGLEDVGPLDGAEEIRGPVGAIVTGALVGDDVAGTVGDRDEHCVSEVLVRRALVEIQESIWSNLGQLLTTTARVDV